MIGALFAEHLASVLPEGLDQISAKFNPHLDILGQLDTEYRAGRALQPRESIHLFLLGVVHGLAGRGVAAACRGANAWAVAIVWPSEATNKKSQHVFRKQGFAERVHRSYNDHRFEGRAFFRSIAEQGGPILMDRRLVS